MSSLFPFFTNRSEPRAVRFESSLRSDKSDLGLKAEPSQLNVILKNHVISTPINKLGAELIAEATKIENSPLWEAHQQLEKVISKYDGQLEKLKSDLSDKKCDWHHARNHADWAQSSKGKNFDTMRCEIKTAMADFSAAVTKEITGNSGKYKDFGTQGYKSDIDLTYIPDEKNKDFSYASGKLIFDALFAATLNRTPEDLFDMEVYVQHPGKSMHTGEMVRTDEGKINFLTAEMQAAFQKIKDPDLAKDLQSAICENATDGVKDGIKEVMRDVEEFNTSMNEFKDYTLDRYELSDADKSDIYGPKSLEYKFAEASFRDTTIYNIYQEHIQSFQEQIQKLEDELTLIPSRDHSMQNAASFTNAAFNRTLEAMGSGNFYDNQASPTATQPELRSSPSSQKSLDNHLTKLQRLPSRFLAETLSADLSRNSSSSEVDLQMVSRIDSYTKANRPLSQLSKTEGLTIASSNSDLNTLSKELSFTKPKLSPINVKRQPTLNSALSIANGTRLYRNQTGFSYDQVETPVSPRQAAIRAQIDELYVHQARYATFTESLTKEGFNTQGALRDIVENRDGQEDSKYAKQIFEKIFAHEVQGKTPPKNVQQLVNADDLTPEFLQKITHSKAASSHASLLNSALENFHFYASHLKESLNRPDETQESKLDSEDSKRSAQTSNKTELGPWSNAMINESKYEMRFAARALDFYKELSRSRILRLPNQNSGLRRPNSDLIHHNSESVKLTSNLSKERTIPSSIEDINLERSVSSFTNPSAKVFDQEIEDLEDLLENAESLEKLKRQEQLPLVAFGNKLAKLDSLFSSKESMETFIESALQDLPKFSSPRLGDIITQAKESFKDPKINPKLITNIGYYKEIISKLSASEGPFQSETLKVGNIQIPVLRLNSDSLKSDENIQKVRDLNTWAMAASGFPSNYYALPQLNEKEIEEYKSKTFDFISNALGAKGDACKKLVFEEARVEVLKSNNLDSYEGVQDYYDNINKIYGQLVRNAFSNLKLLQNPKSYQDDNSLSQPFEKVKGQLLNLSDQGE